MVSIFAGNEHFRAVVFTDVDLDAPTLASPIILVSPYEESGHVLMFYARLALMIE
jgi:hypothetical protein